MTAITTLPDCGRGGPELSGSSAASTIPSGAEGQHTPRRNVNGTASLGFQTGSASGIWRRRLTAASTCHLSGAKVRSSRQRGVRFRLVRSRLGPQVLRLLQPLLLHPRLLGHLRHRWPPPRSCWTCPRPPHPRASSWRKRFQWCRSRSLAQRCLPRRSLAQRRLPSSRLQGSRCLAPRLCRCQCPLRCQCLLRLLSQSSVLLPPSTATLALSIGGQLGPDQSRLGAVGTQAEDVLGHRGNHRLRRCPCLPVDGFWRGQAAWRRERTLSGRPRPAAGSAPQPAGVSAGREPSTAATRCAGRGEVRIWCPAFCKRQVSRALLGVRLFPVRA